MAYQTGSAANGNALKTILTSFMTSNGYTLTNGWYRKGKSSVKLANAAETIFYKLQVNAGSNTALLSFGLGYTENLLNTAIGDTYKIHSPDSDWDGKVGTVYDIRNTSSYATQNTLGLDFTFLDNSYADVYNIGGTYIEKLSTANVEESLVVLCEGDIVEDSTYNVPRRCQIWVDAQDWPVTYHMFASDTQISCVIHYAGTKIMPLFIGEIIKVDDNAYVGGEWAWASGHLREPRLRYPGAKLSKNSKYFQAPYDNFSALPYRSGSNAVPFCGGSYNNTYTWNTRLHCEIGGETWQQGADYYRDSCNPVQYTHATLISAYGGFNPYTNQAQLIPIHLQHGMQDELEAYIGYLDHVRMIRIDHYNIGDVLTIGSDSWMIFPWAVKDLENRDGDGGAVTYHHTGTLGFAVRFES